MQFISIRFVCLAAVAVFATSGFAAPPTDAVKRAELIGQPTVLEIQPAKIALTGPRSTQQLVITGKYADGTIRDLTQLVTIKPEQADLLEISEAWLRGKKNGSTTLVVQAGAQKVKVPVSVQKMEVAQPVSFRHQVIAAMNVGGCNARRLPRHSQRQERLQAQSARLRSRRRLSSTDARRFGPSNRMSEPVASLMINKALGRVPHEGGPRFRLDTVPVRKCSHGLDREGLKDDPRHLAGVKKVEVTARDAAF